jgi:hypothetical protein
MNAVMTTPPFSPGPMQPLPNGNSPGGQPGAFVVVGALVGLKLVAFPIVTVFEAVLVNRVVSKLSLEYMAVLKLLLGSIVVISIVGLALFIVNPVLVEDDPSVLLEPVVSPLVIVVVLGLSGVVLVESSCERTLYV